MTSEPTVLCSAYLCDLSAAATRMLTSIFTLTSEQRWMGDFVSMEGHKKQGMTLTVIASSTGC